MRSLVISASCALLLSAHAAIADVRVTLEEPVDFGTASGVANIRGWAVADEGIDYLELYIDDEYASEIPYGGDRGDVGAAFPDIEDSRYSGFGMTFNYSLLTPGEHTMTVRAYSDEGEVQEASATFQAVSFGSAFLTGEVPFDLADADIYLDRESGVIILEDVRIDDKEYEVSMVWSEAAQSYQMNALWVSDDEDGVEPDGDSQDEDDDYTGSGEVEFDGEVTQISAGRSITIANIRYEVDTDTAYFIEDRGQVTAETFFATVSVGSSVEVTEYLPTDGIADELELEEDFDDDDDDDDYDDYDEDEDSEDENEDEDEDED